jgi:hypothetical protein
MSNDRLIAGQTMKVGDKLMSPNKVYELILQDDGNLVLLGGLPHAETVLWASGTEKNFLDHAIMQEDCNFVIYSQEGNVLWATGTNATGRTAPSLVLQDDGNLVFYASTSFWATNTEQ